MGNTGHGRHPLTVCNFNRVAQQVKSLGVTYNDDSTALAPPAKS